MKGEKKDRKRERGRKKGESEREKREKERKRERRETERERESLSRQMDMSVLLSRSTIRSNFYHPIQLDVFKSSALPTKIRLLSYLGINQN